MYGSYYKSELHTSSVKLCTNKHSWNLVQ